jgi:predicted alpha/beta-hydrolase family hydrolase
MELEHDRPSRISMPPAREYALSIATKQRTILEGTLVVPEGATGVIVFAHGSGSSRESPRSRYAARMLQRRGLATALIDLLTNDEKERERLIPHLQFDIELLTARLSAATGWLAHDERTRDLPIGCFASGTGAAAALRAATRTPIASIVSRGGRPDLAGDLLGGVRSPTLFIVTGEDVSALAWNRKAFSRLRCKKKLETITQADQLREGAFERAAASAADWFAQHLAPGRA